MLASICRASLSVFVAAALHAQTTFRFSEPPGEYPVGLKVVEQYDSTRVFYTRVEGTAGQGRGGPRPIQTLIWFPARKVSGGAMTVAGYGDLAGTETNFSSPERSAQQDQWKSAVALTLTDELRAHRDAVAAPGRFPVVIYAPSYSATSWENADLCEYLASRGYVVIASPAMGATSRGMTNDLAGINAEARDISFLIDYAGDIASADMTRVAVIGYSWGGISNLFAAARDRRIKALIALDGEMRYSPGFVGRAKDVHPEQMTIPLLFITQGEITLEDQKRWFTDAAKSEGPSVLNSWTRGDLLTVHMMGLTHFEFSSMSQRNEDNWRNYAEQRKADYTREDGMVGYSWSVATLSTSLTRT